MKVFFSLGSIISMALLCVIAQPVQAQVQCGYFDGTRPYTKPVPLLISRLTVPRDMPIGTRFYVQSFVQNGPAFRYQCDRPELILSPKFIVEGALINSDSTANATYAGKIYKTNVAGVGVAWYENYLGAGPVGTSGQMGPSITSCTAKGPNVPLGSCRTAPLGFTGPAMSLIKIGPTAAGVIEGSSLGSLKFSASFGDSDDYEIARLTFSGSITIVSKTCQTPNVNVPMGSYKTSSLTGKGSTTPMVNFTIELTDCPEFSGYYANSGGKQPTSSEVGNPSFGQAKENTISIQVDPVTTPIDAASGVLSLNAGTGELTATGVGVQLLSSSGAPQALSQPLGVSINASTTSIKIPLGARYLQTADKVTAGKANAVATYTIIYN